MSFQSIMSNLVQTIINAPIGCLLLLKITAILAVAWLLHWALSKANPRWRVLLWRTTAVGLFALPAIVLAFPALQIHFQPPSVKVTASIPPAVSQNSIAGTPQNPPPQVVHPNNAIVKDGRRQVFPSPAEPLNDKKQVQHPVVQPSFTPSYSVSVWDYITAKTVLAVVWLIGISILSVRFWLGYRRVVQISNSAKKTPEWIRDECKRVADNVGCNSQVDVMQSEDILSPYLCGLRKARLLLPDRMCQVLYRTDLPGIFAHELTHVQHRDLLWNAFLHTISILLWFHPLAWRLRKAHLTACELVCDAVSAGFVGDVNEYCRTLARVAVATYEIHPAAGLAMAKLSTISRRLEALKKHVFHLPLRRRYAIAFGIAALLIVAVLGVIQFAFAESAAKEQKTVAAKEEIKTAENDKKANKKELNPEKIISDKNAKADEKPKKKADSSTKTGSIQLRVIDKDEKPISGANIIADYYKGKNNYVTDADGNATVEFPESNVKNLRLNIHAEGHVPVTWLNTLSNSSPPNELTLKMEQARIVGGIVHDEQGKPIKAVNVELHREFNQGLMPLEPISQTDSAGRWKYTYAPKSLNDVTITLQHPDFIDQGLIRLSAVQQDKLGELSAVMVMKRGVTISGTVTDPDGKPVSNALVAQGTDRYSTIGKFTTRSNQEGHYRLTLVQLNANVLTVVSPGLAPSLRQIDTNTVSSPIDFQLKKGNTILVHIVDKTGMPVEGVNIAPDTWREYRTLVDTGIAGKTNKDGRWTWTWAPNDSVEMSIYKSGYMSIRNLPLSPLKSEQVITIYPQLIISGKVIDARSKQPIPNFLVVRGNRPRKSVTNELFWSRYDEIEGKDGRYKVAFSEPSVGSALKIVADGYLPAVSHEFKSDEGSVTYDFMLSKADNLKVTVLLSDGKPAADAEVLLCPSPPDNPYRMATFIKNGHFVDQNSSISKLKVSADGILSIPPQESDYFIVIIHDQGFAKTTSQDLKAKPEIQLEAWARLEGLIRQGTNPLPNVKLDVYENGQYDPKWSFLNFQDQTETDAEGKFYYPKLLPGKWSVRVLPSNKPEITALFQRPIIVELTAGKTTNVTLGGTGRPVVGKIQWPDGQPQDGDLAHIGADIRPKTPEMKPIPKVVRDQGPDAARQWRKQWSESEEGKAWQKEAQKQWNCPRSVSVSPDGTVKIEELVPGTYDLSVYVIVKEDRLPWERPQLLDFSYNFTLPEISGGVSDEPLHLGNILLKDTSPKKLPTAPVNPPVALMPGEKKIGNLSDNMELLRYVIVTYKQNKENIQTWQGRATVENRGVYSKRMTGSDYFASIQFVFDRSKKSVRWNTTLNKYASIVEGKDVPQPVPQISNGILTPEALYRYGLYGTLGNPAQRSLNLIIYSLNKERIQPQLFDFNPFFYLETFRGDVARELAAYTGWADSPGLSSMKVIREGDNITIDMGNDQSYNRYTLSLSQGCNPISCEAGEPGSTSQWKWTYEKIDGIWLPKTWTETVRQKDQRDEDRKVVFVENVLNQPVEAGAFSLPSLGIKPGDDIQDRRVDPTRHYKYEGENK